MPSWKHIAVTALISAVTVAIIFRFAAVKDVVVGKSTTTA